MKLLEDHDYYLKSFYKHNSSDLEALILMSTLYAKDSNERAILKNLIDYCSKINGYLVPIIKEIYHINVKES